jgi:hypothetical protein
MDDALENPTPFARCFDWLTDKAEASRKNGFDVELQKSTDWVRLRIENWPRLFELTVWSHGIGHAVVIDLRDGEIVLECDGVPIHLDPATQFGLFFEALSE